MCGIVWLKDGLPIDEDDERYTIEYGERAPNYAKNDFESVYSTLNFNIDRWPGGKLDRIIDNANYTCQSKSWQMTSMDTEGVSSTTYFRVECKQCIFFFIKVTSIDTGALEIHINTLLYDYTAANNNRKPGKLIKVEWPSSAFMIAT